MTAHTTLIDQWLAAPYRLPAEEQQQLAELLSRYPYLVPARWMESASQYASKQEFSDEMLQGSQLFMGNWLLFHQSVLSAQSEKTAASVIPEVENIDIKEETILPTDEPQARKEEPEMKETEELIQPLYVDNYFQHQGIAVSEELPEELDKAAHEEAEKALMVMMGFDEWLMFLKKKNDAKRSDEEDKAFVRSMWQREKLAAAMGEEDDNIPEAVFEMAINSIDKQDIMVSEPLAEIHIKQGRYDKAIEIYRKLSLQNPEKKTYFAAKINHLNKEKLS